MMYMALIDDENDKRAFEKLYKQYRNIVLKLLHSVYDNNGEYDVAMPNASSEFISSVSDADTLSGIITVYGRMEINGQEFEYGSLDDPHGLAHIPLDSGRLPENENEVAVDKGVLRLIGYAGKSGDHIIFEEKEYILCGIISENYGTQRKTFKYDNLDDITKIITENGMVLFEGNNDE